MASRYGRAYNITKKEIKTLVQLKHHGNVSEWWIYRKKESRFIDTQGKNLQQNEIYLYCIIICDKENNGKRLENEGFIAVEGVKVTNDEEGNDLDNYINAR